MLKKSPPPGGGKFRTAVAFALRGPAIKKGQLASFSQQRADLAQIAATGHRIAPSDLDSFKEVAGPYIDPQITNATGGSRGVKYLRLAEFRKRLDRAEKFAAAHDLARENDENLGDHLSDFATQHGTTERGLARWKALAKKVNKIKGR
jgi:hypothetical protein